jgi:hypothetical protein
MMTRFTLATKNDKGGVPRSSESKAMVTYTYMGWCNQCRAYQGYDGNMFFYHTCYSAVSPDSSD